MTRNVLATIAVMWESSSCLGMQRKF